MQAGFKRSNMVLALAGVGLLMLSATTAVASTGNGIVATRSAPASDGVAGPLFQVTGLESCGCAEHATGFYISYNIPVGAVVHTLVTVSGVVYMDELVTNFSGSGTTDWHLYYANQGGTATGTWPLPSGQPIHVTITLVDEFHRVLGGWELVLDGCGNCSFVTSQELQGQGGGIPTAGFFGLAALAALLLIAGVFIILRLRA